MLGSTGSNIMNRKIGHNKPDKEFVIMEVICQEVISDEDVARFIDTARCDTLSDEDLLMIALTKSIERKVMDEFPDKNQEELRAEFFKEIERRIHEISVPGNVLQPPINYSH